MPSLFAFEEAIGNALMKAQRAQARISFPCRANCVPLLFGARGCGRDGLSRSGRAGIEYLNQPRLERVDERYRGQRQRPGNQW